MTLDRDLNAISSSTSMSDILNICNLSLPENPRGTDKDSLKSYVKNFYEKEFSNFRNKKIRILEIGFRHGASLALWSHYFSEAEIIGIDNGSDNSVTLEAPICDDWLSLPNITTVYGDAYNEKFSSDIIEKFNILIDDGPHTLSSQLKFIKYYHSKLCPNGLMIVEDIQRYGGLTIWPFLFVTPFKYQVEFHDFRMRSGVTDDIIFVVRNSGQKQVISRFYLILRALLYLIFEPARAFKVSTIKLKNSFFR